MRSLLLITAFAATAFARDSWPPPLPKFETAASPRAPSAGEFLNERALTEGVAVIARVDGFGVGVEASRLGAWLAGRRPVLLTQNQDAWTISVGGDTISISATLGLALKRLHQFTLVEDAARARPVSTNELRTALLSPQGVETIRRLFDKAMEAPLRISGKLVVPEIGGEATLDGQVRYYFMEDVLRPTLKTLLERRDDPDALRRLYAEEPKKMAQLDRMGTLRHHLATRARWDAEDKIPRQRRDDVLRMVVDDVAQNSVDTYTNGAKEELEATLSHDWPGRYLGHWHLHPPDAGKGGWTETPGPSGADIDGAAENGREIVIAFRPDGFDVYDLLKTNKPFLYGDPPSFSYTSAGWRRHFQDVYDRLIAPAPR
mgnify:CR=1 FL=1